MCMCVCVCVCVCAHVSYLPLIHAWLQNVYAPDPDPELTVEHYERTHEQNDVLGLNEMKVENYEE